jgi:hypothetical protein
VVVIILNLIKGLHLFDQILPKIPGKINIEKNSIKYPVHQFKQEILASIFSNRISIIAGESGNFFLIYLNEKLTLY